MAKLYSSCDIMSIPNDFTYKRPLELFEENNAVKICSPMVRYSKLAFRLLVRRYGCDLCFTPMIISNSFVRSQKARDNDFTTHPLDRPLVVQFAASNAEDFVGAMKLVEPYSNGVDLNCGCPQKWAMAENYGAALITQPELMADILSQARRNVTAENFTVSAKIRIHDDIRETVELGRRVEKMGAAWLTVHARTAAERHQPVHLDATKILKEQLSIPVVHNGDVKCLDDVTRFRDVTGANGFMSARGILANPSLFAGHLSTPKRAVRDWLHLALNVGTPFNIFHHHLTDMLEQCMCKAERRVFNSLGSTPAVLDYLDEHFAINTSKETVGFSSSRENR